MGAYSDATLVKVRDFAKMRHSPEKIAILLGLPSDEVEEFLDDIATEDHQLKRMYDQGYVMGDYEVEKGLLQEARNGNMDAEFNLRQRQKERRIAELKKDLFGV